MPQYYGSGRMEEEYSECESLVGGSLAGSGVGGMMGMGGNGMGGHHTNTLPSHHPPYSR